MIIPFIVSSVRKLSKVITKNVMKERKQKHLRKHVWNLGKKQKRKSWSDNKNNIEMLSYTQKEEEDRNNNNNTNNK
jgi:hypothetical protein